MTAQNVSVNSGTTREPERNQGLAGPDTIALAQTPEPSVAVHDVAVTHHNDPAAARTLLEVPHLSASRRRRAADADDRGSSGQ